MGNTKGRFKTKDEQEMGDTKRLYISPEELEFIKSTEMSEEETLCYWLKTGVPSGVNLEDHFPAEMVEKVKREVDVSYS